MLAAPLERIAAAVGSVAGSGDAPSDDWIGQRFGPYRVISEIGRGGMGVVFTAIRDDREYEKTVALKIAPWTHHLDILRERFRQERQILAELEHPNIARLMDGGTEGGVPYFVMEYVPGVPSRNTAARSTCDRVWNYSARFAGQFTMLISA